MLKNNQYDKTGNYLFPDVETKIKVLEVSEDEFFTLLFKHLNIPQKYLRVYLFILRNKDLQGKVDVIRLRKSSIPPDKYMERIWEMNKQKFEGETLLQRIGYGLYKVNPYFHYDLRKSKSFLIEVKHTI